MGSDRGSTAILVVFGVGIVMLLVGSTLITQMIQEIKMSRAERDVAVVQATVTGVVNQLIVLTESDPGWPTAHTDSGPCVPPGGSYPSWCVDALERRPAEDWRQIPFRVVVKPSANSGAIETYGWIIRNIKYKWDPDIEDWVVASSTTDYRVFHRWCPLPEAGQKGNCGAGG